RLQDPSQMLRPEGDHMIGALAPDRSNQPLGVAVLPWRGGSDGLVADAHGPQSAQHSGSRRPILVADQITGGFVPRNRLRDLAGNPLGRWICRNVDLGPCSRPPRTGLRDLMDGP